MTKQVTEMTKSELEAEQEQIVRLRLDVLDGKVSMSGQAYHEMNMRATEVKSALTKIYYQELKSR